MYEYEENLMAELENWLDTNETDVTTYKSKKKETIYKFLGRDCRIFPWSKIICPENISIGDGVIIDDFAFLYATGKGIEIGSFSHITVGCVLMAGGLIKIGSFSAVSPNSVVLAESDDYKGGGFIGNAIFPDKYRNRVEADVIIGNHVHIAVNCVILPGITLGDGCSIGAGSIVTKDMPEWTICYGNPCKPIKDKPREYQLAMEKEFLDEYYRKNTDRLGYM
jgi:acetyltransferase-like isoleucine patch superfamily enzyme